MEKIRLNIYEIKLLDSLLQRSDKEQGDLLKRAGLPLKKHLPRACDVYDFNRLNK